MAMLVISYSRVDRSQVRGIVSLLRGAMRGIVDHAVFWDGQLEPGDLWFDEIRKHIDAAPQLFVFWCAHASASAEVRREFLYAVEQKKRVIPVLLDDTPLAAELAPISGIDLRGVVRHGEAALVPSRAVTRAAALRTLALAAAVALATLAGVRVLSLRPLPNEVSPVPPSQPAVATLDSVGDGGTLDANAHAAIDAVAARHQPGDTRVVIVVGDEPGADRSAALAQAYLRERFGVEADYDSTPAIRPLHSTVTIERKPVSAPVESPTPWTIPLWLAVLAVVAAALAVFPLIRRSTTQRYVVREFARHLR